MTPTELNFRLAAVAGPDAITEPELVLVSLQFHYASSCCDCMYTHEEFKGRVWEWAVGETCVGKISRGVWHAGVWRGADVGSFSSMAAAFQRDLPCRAAQQLHACEAAQHPVEVLQDIPALWTVAVAQCVLRYFVCRRSWSADVIEGFKPAYCH